MSSQLGKLEPERLGFWSSNPLAAPALAFAAGILLGRYIAIAPAVAIGAGCAMLAAALFPARRAAFVLLLAAIVTLGLGWENYSVLDPVSFPTQPQTGTITGTVASLPQALPGKTVFRLKDCTIENGSPNRQDRYSVMLTVHSRARISAPGANLRFGDVVRVRAKLRKPSRAKNPGGFDSYNYWRRRGIDLLASCSASETLRKVSRGTGGPLTRLVNLLWDWRRSFDKLIQETCDPTRAPMIRALIFGHSAAVSQGQRQLLKRLGVAHIIVISGLHIGLVALAFYKLFAELLLLVGLTRRATLARRATCLLTIIPIALYATIAGPRIPTTRAVIMVVSYLIARAADRDRQLLNVVALAAAIILVWDPNSLFDAGFQLTFAATLAIPPCVAYFRRRFALLRTPGLLSTIGTLIIAATAAAIATAPLTARWFGQISLAGPVVNSLIVPLAAVTVNLVLAAFFIFPASSYLSALLLSVCDTTVWLINTILEALRFLPGASILVSTPTVATCALFYLALVSVSLVSSAKKKAIAGLIGLAFLLASLGLGNRPVTKGLLRVAFLDVGRGVAAIAELPDGKTALIDGGGSRFGGFDVGNWTLLPYLRYRGIRKIDYIVVTSPRPEHIEGAIALLEQAVSPNLGRIKIGRLILADFGWHGRRTNKLLLLARHLRLPIERIRPGRYARRNSLILASLADRSLVVKLEFDRFSILFPGDIACPSQSLLLSYGSALKSTILVAPNSGQTPINEEFFNQVSPHALIFSCSTRPKLLQSETELLQYRQPECKIFRTDLHHCIIVESDGEHFAISTPLAEKGLPTR